MMKDLYALLTIVCLACVALCAPVAHGADGADGADGANGSDKPWFVGVGDKPKGPISAAAVEKLIEKGEVDGTTLAWQDGMADWKPLSDIARFRALVVKPPPLPKVSTPSPLPTTSAPQRAKPPPMPTLPIIVMTPPPLPAMPPAARRVIGASNGASAPPPLVAATTRRGVKLIVAVPDDVRARAEERLRECALSDGAVGVIRVLRGVVTVSTTPANACVSRALQTVLANSGVASALDEEPFEIIVDAR